MRRRPSAWLALLILYAISLSREPSLETMLPRYLKPSTTLSSTWYAILARRPASFSLRAMAVLPSDEGFVVVPKKLCDLFVVVVEPVLVYSLCRPYDGFDCYIDNVLEQIPFVCAVLSECGVLLVGIKRVLTSFAENSFL